VAEARARLGRAGPLRLLAGAPTFADLVKRRYLLDRIVQGEAAALRAAQEAQEELAGARAQREEEAARLGLPAVWLQDGSYDDAALEVASKGPYKTVYEACIMVVSRYA